MLKQGLQQKLLQKLSPQQIQFIKLLQLNTVDLQQRIDAEMIENPALVKSEDIDAAPPLEEPTKETETVDDGQEENISVEDYLSNESLDVKEYVNDDYESDGFHLSDESPDDDKKEMPLAESRSFHDQLAEQFNAIAENEREQIMGNQIIGTIDDDGYLRRPLEALQNDLAFSQNLETSIDELRACLTKIQALDPAGIAATSLQECLLLQLKRKDHNKEAVRFAEILMRDYFMILPKSITKN
jgi:RNA polymerase sigma-54 factor